MSFFTDFPARQDEFAAAGQQLTERMIHGLGTLRSLHAAADADERGRLSAKIDGLEDAFDVWSKLCGDRDDPAGNWRTFTAKITEMLADDGYLRAYKDGLTLALEYQRGYAPHIDGPVAPLR